MTSRRLVMQWNLRQVMATRGLFQTSDLIPLLEEREHPPEPPMRAQAGDQDPPAGEHRLARRAVRHLGLHSERPARADVEAVEEAATAQGDRGSGDR